jgi:hypothetical protein
MEDSDRFEALTRMGEKILKELKGGAHSETLTRWMAHYLAEKLAEAKAAHRPNRAEKQRLCAQEILRLWEHRLALPIKNRPFSEFDTALRVLENLQQNEASSRYFQFFRNLDEEFPRDSQYKNWIQSAVGIDSAARVIVRFCLSMITSASQGRREEWLALAEGAGLAADHDIQLVKRIIANEELFHSETPSDEQRKEIEDMIGKLRAFESIATNLADVLEERLAQASSSGLAQAKPSSRGRGRGPRSSKAKKGSK